MKKICSNKWICIPLCSALAIFLIFGIIIPMINGIKHEHEDEVEYAVHELVSYPKIDEDSIEDFVEKMEKAVDAGWKRKAFDDAVLESIAQINGGSDSLGFESAIYDISAQLILLEAAGYESEDLRKAYEEQIQSIIDLQYNRLDFDDFVEALINEPYPTNDQVEKIYDTTLSYYTYPKTYFISEYINGIIANSYAKALDNKNGNDLMKLCYELSVLNEYSEFDINEFVNMKNLVNTLTAESEKIIIKSGEGGYYDDCSNNTSVDNQSDELFDQVAGALSGADVDSNKQKFRQVKYFGDLKSYYFESGLYYSYKDEEGNTQHGGNTDVVYRHVYLKDKLIFSGATVNEKNIKEAFADGMVNYHKDGNCYGISDSVVVCYVGDYLFVLDFVK